MFPATIAGLTFVVALAAIFAWRVGRRRERAWSRFLDSEATTTFEETPPAARRLRRRWRLVPGTLGIVASAFVAWLIAPAPPYVVAIGLSVAILASQVEAYLAAQVVARLESQLADAIDIMIGAVGAGASVNAAIDAAVSDARHPLRPYLAEMGGRIRLGDSPVEVFESFSERVPLETVLLFTSALAVNWEVGGRVTTTLTSVGRTIRDRIEISRRIQSNTAQSQFSTMAIVGLTYFIAVVVWRNGPGQMEEFVKSSIGSWFVAGSVVLQAMGIVWMNVISRPRF